MKRLLLFGYFGLDNFGDDLLLWTACLRLGRLVEKGEAELTILSNAPYVELPIPAKYVPRKNYAAVVRAISRSDIVCAPGGGLLQDTTSVTSLMYYLGIIKLAQRFGKKTALLAQGIGPLKNPWSGIATRKRLEKVTYLSVRDKGSAEQLSGSGFKRTPEITADLTFALKKALMPGEIRPAGDEDGNSLKILFCLKQFGLIEQQIMTLTTATHFLKKLLPNSEMKFGYAPLHRGQDTVLANEIARRVNGTVFDYNPGDPVSEYGYFNWADIVVSYRLHGCVLAAQSKRPFIAIAYDPKVDALAKMFSMPVLIPEALDPSALAEAVEGLYISGFGDGQRDALDNAELNAERDIDALIELIRSR